MSKLISLIHFSYEISHLSDDAWTKNPTRRKAPRVSLTQSEGGYEGRAASSDGRAMTYGKKGLKIRPLSSDDSAASSPRMVSSASTLITSSMYSASASVFGFLAQYIG
jgi:hypothetical protein